MPQRSTGASRRRGFNRAVSKESVGRRKNRIDPGPKPGPQFGGEGVEARGIDEEAAGVAEEAALEIELPQRSPRSVTFAVPGAFLRS